MSDQPKDSQPAQPLEGDPLAAAQPRVGFFSRFTRTTVMTRDGLRDASHVLNVIRAPLAVSLLGVLVFGFLGQIYEIYRLFAEDFSIDQGFTFDNLRFFLFLLSLHVVCYVLWYVARVLTLADPKARGALMGSTRAASRVARWAPRVIGAAPAFAAAIGLASAEALREGAGATPGLYGAAAIAFLIGVMRLWSSWVRTRAREQRYDDLSRSAFRVDLRVLMAVILIGGIAFLMSQPVELTQTIGALTIICFFMIALVFGWAQLTFVNDRYAIPALTLLIGAGVVWAALDWNDNHFVRELPPDADAAAVQAARDAAQVYGPRKPLSVRAAFEQWLESRANKPAYDAAGERYPVYIVAAQGGGLYAAYQSAMFLARLQDECPTFAQHVFAISGVSGGAVGAATFTSLALEHARNQPIESVDEPCGVAELGPDGAPVSFVEKTETMLSQDFLSPVVSGMLFGDFTARFSPVPIPAFDRARALEGAFETAWSRAHPQVGDYVTPNRLEEGILSYWDPTGAAPAVLFNATEVETGRRMILSPIERVNSTLRTYAAAAEPRVDGSIPDMRLSTAAMVSARFPFITPAASMRLKRNPDSDAGAGFHKLRLVDGGYYENSGVETVQDLVLEMRDQRARRASRVQRDQARQLSPEARQAERNQRLTRLGRNVDLRVIVFDLTKDRFRAPSYSFGEATAPLKALLNTRVSRSAEAQERVRERLRAPCRYIFLGGGRPPASTAASDEASEVCLPSEVRRSRVWSVSLNDFEYDFQLGWILSRATLRQISEQLGSPNGCRPGGARTVNEPEAQEAAAERLGFADGISITDQAASAPPETTDALAQHNGCVASFITEMLRIAPPPAPSDSAESGPARESRTSPANAPG